MKPASEPTIRLSSTPVTQGPILHSHADGLWCEECPDALLKGRAVDHELLVDILDSQLRTEKLVTEFITAIKPTVEAMSKGGIMGLLGAMRS